MGNNLELINGIKDLEQAIFSNLSKSILKFSTTIIRVSKIDEFGFIYFSVKKPYWDISGFDKEFPGQLQFYKKSRSYYIKAEGIATIMQKEAFTDTYMGLLADNDNMIWIEFRVTRAELFTQEVDRKLNFGYKIQTGINNLFNYMFSNMLFMPHSK